MRLDAGTPVRCEMTKWGDRPHWVYPGTYLGSDDHGEWIGFPAGTTFARPGATFTGPNDQVTLVPTSADGTRPGFLATFHAPGGFIGTTGGRVPVTLYVDITTPATWDGAVLRAVDLDLDVVRGTSGRVWVDDEDEFADHRSRWGYPEDVVAAALGACRAVEAAVRRHERPFDGETHLPWLDRLTPH